jgi:hypothetical protein
VGLVLRRAERRGPVPLRWRVVCTPLASPLICGVTYLPPPRLLDPRMNPSRPTSSYFYCLTRFRASAKYTTSHCRSKKGNARAGAGLSVRSAARRKSPYHSTRRGRKSWKRLARGRRRRRSSTKRRTKRQRTSLPGAALFELSWWNFHSSDYSRKAKAPRRVKKQNNDDIIIFFDLST